MKDKLTRDSFFPSLHYSITPLLYSLFIFWRYPRFVAWLLLFVALNIVARIPFLHVQIIPHYLDFQPGIVLIPLGAVFLGPAGVWGAFLGSLAGDALFHQWGNLSLFRAIGFFLFGLCTQRLWYFSFDPNFHIPDPEPTWNRTLRFILISWPGCLLDASWRAFGCEVSKVYPFVYIESLLILNNLLFCTMLGVPLYRIMARHWIPNFGSWREKIYDGREWSNTGFLSMMLIFVGSSGACLAGLYAGNIFYNIKLFEPFMLGASTGLLVPWVVFPFLAMQLAGLFRR